MIYNMEFKGSAVKKMYMLPVSVPAMYLSKFLILTVMFLLKHIVTWIHCRCGVAYASVGKDLMPTEERGSIGR